MQSVMSRMEKIVVRLFAGAVVMTIAGGAVAQQSPRGLSPRPGSIQRSERAAQTLPAPTIDTPQRTTATYEDWIVQCETRAGSPPEKLCDMAQVTQVQGRNAPFSRVAIARPVRGQPIKLVVQVPVNASFATSVRIQAGEGDAGLAVPFARCMPAGCFADFDLKEEALRKFRSASSTGKLTFADAGGHAIAVPLSFKGFAQAFDALARE